LDDFAPSIPTTSRECPVPDLAIGMMTQEDICNSAGLLIMPKGQELTLQWIERLKGLSKLGVIGSRLKVSMLGNDG
jgi:hypothetical protein